MQKTGNPESTCASGTCETTCKEDSDCNPSAGEPGGIASVCAMGVCTPLGCSSDNDCSTGGLHSFCIAATTGTMQQHVSAITN